MSRSQQQVMRMLALVPYLQHSDGLPVNQIARELGVTPKVIRDDLKLLMFTGTGEYAGELIDFDLTALERDGVVHIRDADFMTRPLRITAREGAALIVALRTLRASAAGAQLDIIDSALAKIESAVGDTTASAVDVVVDQVDAAMHAQIAKALESGKRIHLAYAPDTRDERSERDVDPRRLFTRNGRLYLEAWCLKAQDLRFFRLDRILEVTPTDHDVTEHTRKPRGLDKQFFSVGPDTPFMVVDLHPRAHWLSEYYHVDVIDKRDDGIWRAKIYGADTEWLFRLAMRNAGSLTVVEPADLRQQVVDDAAQALKAYDVDVVAAKEN
jgi:proteasome accessory factor C